MSKKYLALSMIPVLQPAGPVALGERSVIITTVLLCSIVVVPVFVMLFFFAWRYSANNPHAKVEHKPDWDHDNIFAEAVWWIIPAIIIAALSVLAWRSSHALDPYVPLQSSTPPITVEVVALDWKWLFIYPAQGIASVNMLEFPQNTPVHFELTAMAPMNSFWIPQLGGQIMVMPGMITQLNLMANQLGSFDGYSGNISGDGFAGMAFKANSVSENEFDEWVEQVKQSSQALTPASYAALEEPSTYNPVSFYAPVDAGLYTGTVMHFMMPNMPQIQNTP